MTSFIFITVIILIMTTLIASKQRNTTESANDISADLNNNTVENALIYVSISDKKGKVVCNEIFNPYNHHEEKFKVKVPEDLPKGKYFVSVIVQGHKTTQKVIVK